jgi:hypothetical protein
MGRTRAAICTLISGGITALVIWLLPQSEGARDLRGVAP